RRHATLRTPEEFLSFLRRETPRHVYYSSAYYQRPAAPTMAEKGWQGADLNFDLDSDHLRGAESLDYAGQLALVKTRLVALVDDFLFSDFGIDPASTSFVFSGGRGYHVHVGDTGPVGRSTPRTRTLAPPDAPGWRGRTTRALLEMLRRWEEQGSKVAADEMIRYGVAPPKARRYAMLLIDQGGAAKFRTQLSLDVFRTDLPANFLEAVVPRAAIEVKGETDAPVTTDIHRLIRLPNSLHGGTGFRVVPLARDEITHFDPFRDALLTASSGSNTALRYLE